MTNRLDFSTTLFLLGLFKYAMERQGLHRAGDGRSDYFGVIQQGVWFFSGHLAR